MLGRRVLTAAVLVPLALAGLFLLPPQAWGLASGVVVAIGAAEWGRLARWGRAGRMVFLVAVAAPMAVWLVADPAASTPAESWLWAGATLCWALVAVPWLAGGWQVGSHAALAVAGWCVLVPAWVAAYRLQAHPAQLLAVMAVIWIADTGAYFAGRRFGRHKLAPTISPGKTWEGVAGAAVAVGLYCIVVQAGWPGVLPAASLVSAVGLGMGLLALSIVGDLFESRMKRDAGVKDSGRILPGHGGILDRIDSLTASLPAAALAFRLGGHG